MMTATHDFGRRNVEGGTGQPRNRDFDYAVVYDPSGDYRPGATFALTELGYMMGDGSIEPGTVLRHRSGTTWRVAGRELVAQ